MRFDRLSEPFPFEREAPGMIGHAQILGQQLGIHGRQNPEPQPVQKSRSKHLARVSVIRLECQPASRCAGRQTVPP
jgi:hypothetical protein